MYSEKNIKKILEEVSAGSLSQEEAYTYLSRLPYENLSHARIDHHRNMRKGIPEAVYAPPKTLEQLVDISIALKERAGEVFISRLEKHIYDELITKCPFLKYNEKARIAYYKDEDRNDDNGFFTVLTAGTGDIPVAEEASVTLEFKGKKVKRFFDCGVAGIHRLTDILGEISESKAIICVAGMEGALPGVVAGLVAPPVIGVPTSVGFGSAFKGVAPLLTMLNACSQGLAVVNIDGGFSAACFALSMEK